MPARPFERRSVSRSAPPAPPAQGDTDAHKFYVMERGAADVHIYKEAWGEERPVLSYGPGRWASRSAQAAPGAPHCIPAFTQPGQAAGARATASLPACIEPVLPTPAAPCPPAQRLWRAGAAVLGATRCHRQGHRGRQAVGEEPCRRASWRPCSRSTSRPHHARCSTLPAHRTPVHAARTWSPGPTSFN